MAGETDKLKYELSADSSKYLSGFNAADRATLSLDNKVAGLTKGLGGLAGAAAVAAGAAALGGVVAIMVDGVKSSSQWERRLLRTEALIRATGNAAGFSAQELSQFAQGLDLSTLADRDQIMDAINAMQTFKSVQGDIFKESIRLSEDLAETLGVDLKGQAVQLGKALEDPINGLTSLRRVGVSFTEGQKEMIKAMVEAGRTADAQRAILKVLKEQVGGAAVGAAGGLAGKVDTLNFRWREFKESLATSPGVIDTVGAALDKLSAILEKLSKMDFRNLNPIFSMGNKILKAGGKGGDVGVFEMLSAVNKGGLDRLSGSQVPDDIWGGDFGGPSGPSGPSGGGLGAGPAKKKKSSGGFDNYEDSWMPSQVKKQADERYEVLSRQYELELQLEADHLEASKALNADFWQVQIDERQSAEDRAIDLINRRKEAEKAAAMTAVQQSKYALKEFGKNSETAFKAYQAVAIGETVVSTAKAAMNAYSAMAGIPYVGPALGVAAAAAAIAFGAAQISAISSASPGGGAVGGTSGGAIGTYPANPDTGMPRIDPALAEEGSRGKVVFDFRGATVMDPEKLAIEVVNSVNDLADKDIYINYAKETVA